MKRKGNVTFGILLILAGALFLVVELVPSVSDWYSQFAGWPFWVIGPGLLFLTAAVISGVSALAIPGSIISGLGLILHYQESTGDWESWAYGWTLIVGFVGIGVFLMHLLDGNIKKAFKEGINLVLTSAIMFLMFGSMMRAIFGQEPFFGDYWPVLIIIWGFWMLIKPLLRGSRKPKKVESDFEVIVDLDDVETEDVEVTIEVETPEETVEEKEEEEAKE